MLAAAESLTDAVLASHDFSQKAEAVTGIGQKMSMIPVVREYRITRIPKHPDDCHLTQLLAEAGVCRAGKLASAKQVEECLFNLANKAAECVQLRWRVGYDRPAVLIAFKRLGKSGVPLRLLSQVALVYNTKVTVRDKFPACQPDALRSTRRLLRIA